RRWRASHRGQLDVQSGNCREAHMVRPLLIALVLHAGAATAAESLHLAPLGTVVSGSFDLAGKLIPLPAGNFALAAATVSEPPMLEGDSSKPRAKIPRVAPVQVAPARLR